MIYLIGSLRNPNVPEVAEAIRAAGFEVFDDWHAAGPEADDWWQKYENRRGRSYAEALQHGHAARNVFAYDRYHLLRARGVVMLAPAGKSAHLELGWIAGMGKPAFVLYDGEPERYDAMTQFATSIHFNVDDLVRALTAWHWAPVPKRFQPATMADAMWLAGLLEGEGSFVSDGLRGQRQITTVRPRPRIALSMTDEDVVRRVAGILNVPVNGPYSRPAPRKTVWSCQATGALAAEWMRILKPYMGQRRQQRIEQVLSLFDPYMTGKWRRAA